MLQLEFFFPRCPDHKSCVLGQTTLYGLDVERRNVGQIHSQKRIRKVAMDFEEGAYHRGHRYACCSIGCFGHGILNGEHMLPLACCLPVC
jgi:hypothetical protein